MAMAETEAVCEQLHLPLQSGSDRILAKMHRGYNAERFLGRLAMARRIIADLTVSTDIIVGFPGETAADFERTLEVVAEARFDQAFMFIFSARPGTAAAAMTDQFVDSDLVKQRFQRLVELQNRISEEINAEMVGSKVEVLVEGPSRKDPQVIKSRTRGGKIVHIPGEYPVGSFLEAEITLARRHHMMGRLY